MHDFLVLGGPVLWIILALGVIALGVFLERSLQLHRERIDATDFLQGIFNALRRGNESEAAAICDETPGPVARLASLAIRRRGASRDRFEKELAEAGAAEISRMERRLSLLPLVAQTAPLLGLLGTVLGMFRAFQGVGGDILVSAKPVVLAQGVSLALITTVAGLLVAIPCMAFYAWFRRAAERRVAELECLSSDLVTLLLARRRA